MQNNQLLKNLLLNFTIEKSQLDLSDIKCFPIIHVKLPKNTINQTLYLFGVALNTFISSFCQIVRSDEL